MEAKSSSQMGCFWLFLPDVCQLRSRHIGKFVHATEREISFWPNCSKLAVECDWNSKNSQNVQNLGFFWKNGWVFWKKTWIFLKIDKGGKFAVEWVTNGIISEKCLVRPTYEVFWQKIRTFWKLEKLEKMMQKVFFGEKKRFHLLKSLLYKKLEGAKYAGGSRPSCFAWQVMMLKCTRGLLSGSPNRCFV